MGLTMLHGNMTHFALLVKNTARGAAILLFKQDVIIAAVSTLRTLKL